MLRATRISAFLRQIASSPNHFQGQEKNSRIKAKEPDGSNQGSLQPTLFHSRTQFDVLAPVELAPNGALESSRGAL